MRKKESAVELAAAKRSISICKKESIAQLLALKNENAAELAAAKKAADGVMKGAAAAHAVAMQAAAVGHTAAMTGVEAVACAAAEAKFAAPLASAEHAQRATWAGPPAEHIAYGGARTSAGHSSRISAFRHREHADAAAISQERRRVQHR